MSTFQVTDGYQTRVIDAPSELDARMWFVKEFALPAEDHDYLQVQAVSEESQPARAQPRLTSFGDTLRIAREMGFDVREVYAHRRS